MDKNLGFSEMLYVDKAKYKVAYRLDRKGEVFTERLGDAGLRHFFREYWVNRNLTIFPAQIELVETNKITANVDFEAIFKLGHIPIGTFRNGDILCVAQKAPHAVSILSHDSFWEDQRADFAPLDTRFEWFLIRLAEKRFIPVDYSECMDLNDMVAEDSPPKRKKRKPSRR